MSPTIALVSIVCVAGGCREVRREPARSAAVDQDRPQPAKTAAVDQDRPQPAKTAAVDQDAKGFATPTAAATEYLAALLAKDWPRVCATRMPDERREMARMAGSCEEAFRALFNDKPVQLLRGVKPSAERIRGDLASVDFKHPGQTESAITVCAKKTPDGWLAADVPDSEAP